MSLLDQNGFVALAPPTLVVPPAVPTLRIPQRLDELLDHCLRLGGSDLHLAAGAPPMVRVDGVLHPIEGYGNLHGDMIERIVFAVLNDRKIAAFNSELELDTSYAIPGKSRFRMNVFRQRGAIGAVLRVIPFDIPTFDSLHMPAIIESFAGASHRVTCPRCTDPIVAGQLVVKCPVCRVAHHQSGDSPCWGIVDHCASCQGPTGLSDTYRFTPESLP